MRPIPSLHEVRRTGDQQLAWINRPRPSAAIHRRKWIMIAAIFAAAGVVIGFVAGTAAVDASAVSNSAIRGVISSTVAAHSIHATSFPEANRAAKGNRLAPAEQASDDWDSRHVQSRAPRENERKPVAHCEPVGSSLAGPGILYVPPRSCFA
jgi:hypothetical protein